MSEEELWDQSVQVTLLIHSGAIVLHEGTKERCATRGDKRTVQRGTIDIQNKRNDWKENKAS